MKMYSDESCTKEVQSIKWNSNAEVLLANGRKKLLESTARAGDTVGATVWLKNDNVHPFMVESIKHPDERVSLDLESAWINPNGKVKLRIEFVVPMKITPEDVVKANDIEITGFYRYTEMV